MIFSAAAAACSLANFFVRLAGAGAAGGDNDDDDDDGGCGFVVSTCVFRFAFLSTSGDNFLVVSNSNSSGSLNS